VIIYLKLCDIQASLQYSKILSDTILMSNKYDPLSEILNMIYLTEACKT